MRHLQSSPSLTQKFIPSAVKNSCIKSTWKCYPGVPSGTTTTRWSRPFLASVICSHCKVAPESWGIGESKVVSSKGLEGYEMFDPRDSRREDREEENA